MKINKYLFLIPIAGFIMAIIAVLISVYAGTGNRFGWIDFRAGLFALRISAYVGLIAAIVSLGGIITAFFLKENKGLFFGIFGLLIGLIVLGLPLKMSNIGKKVSPIHDITTDMVNPPTFVYVLPLRKNAVNSTEYDKANTPILQKKCYADIKTLSLNIPADQAFDKALNTAKKMNLKIVASEKNEGRIEAVATTLWMGFKDDVVIRVTKNDTGSLVDIRSLSRVGKGDFGTNAKRVRTFLSVMKA